jgi:hypothetical protein
MKRHVIVAIARTVFAFVITALFFVQVARPQDKSGPDANEKKAQELLNGKRFTYEDLLAGKPEAVEDAKRIFLLTSDPKIKQKGASVLLSIGIKDRIYLDYLADESQKAMERERDMPWPILYDKDGKSAPPGVKQPFNPAFLDWCNKKGLNPFDENVTVHYIDPSPWWSLAAAGDPRAYDLLMKGLHFHNPMIAALSAKGLAKLQDSRAIDEMITVGRRSPMEERMAFVEALVYLPGPKAAAAADELSISKEMTEYYRTEFRKHGVKGLFGY